MSYVQKSSTKGRIFKVAQFNALIEIYQIPTLVEMTAAIVVV